MKLNQSIGATFRSGIFLSILLLAAAPVACGQELRLGEFSDFRLERGSVIRDCQLKGRDVTTT
jgi:hypothetical protein